MSTAEDAKKAMLKKTPPPKKLEASDFLSFGITLANMGTYGNSTCGLAKGRIYRLAGRESTGKTFVCRGILAEAVRNQSFKDYQLIYDDIEHGAMMDTLKFFGQPLVDRMVAPSYNAKTKEPIYSSNTSDLFGGIRKMLDKGKKFIYVADSLDALEGVGENKMTDAKAKAYSQELRKLLDPLMATGSILILISQARANMGTGPFAKQDISAGGRALTHYPSASFWMSKFRTITKTYKEKKYPIGVEIMMHIQKNRISGLDRRVKFKLYNSYGIDDIGSNTTYLIEHGHWIKNQEGIVTAPEFDHVGTEVQLVSKIETNNNQRELQLLVSKVWRQIEAACTPKRIPRYS
jgi:RecA/RadA recombinase